MAASGVPRESVFLQTKVDPQELGYAPTLAASAASLRRLRTDYVDSLLIHKSRCWEGACKGQPAGTWQESWRALEQLHASGQARAIGICDVDDALLDELLRQRVRPHLVQNWMDPLHQDTHVRRRLRAAPRSREGPHHVPAKAPSLLGTSGARMRFFTYNALTRAGEAWWGRARGCR